MQYYPAACLSDIQPSDTMKMLMHEHDPKYSSEEGILCLYQVYFKNTKKHCSGAALSYAEMGT